MDRLWRRHHANAGVAAVGQRDGRNSGAGTGWRASHADRTDIAEAGRTIRQIWRREFRATVPGAALAVLGQSQADRLHGDLSLYQDIHAISRPAGADLLPQAPRRLPWDPGTALAAMRVRHRGPADGGRLFNDRLFVISSRRNRIRFCGQSPGRERLAPARRGSARMAVTLRSVARQASHALRISPPALVFVLVVDQHPADGGEADDDSNRDRPYADPDIADDLPFGFVLGDLAIPHLVLLVGVTHRLVPA